VIVRARPVTFLAAAIMTGAIGAGPLAAQIQPDPRVMRDVTEWTDANIEGVHDLLEQVVNINSGTRNHEGVRAVGDIFLRRLDDIGFDARWIDVKPAVDRAGHVLARREGRGPGRSILLIGHLDTVFGPEHPFDRFVRDGSLATGPGVVDDKGGVVVLVSTLEALAAAGALDGGTISVLLTGDEEDVGDPQDAARRDMVETAADADVVLSFERGFTEGGQDFGTIARRSSSGWVLRASGREAHSSRIFREENGAGAANELARILHTFYEELAGEESLTFNAGTVLAGTDVTFDAESQDGEARGRSNVIPAQAIARGDIRTISNDQLDRTREHMRTIVARHLPGTSATIEFTDGYPAMSPQPENYALLEEYSALSQAIGLGPVAALDPSRRGAGDVAFASDHVAAALDGLGAIGGDTHGPDEWVDLDSFAPQIRRAAALVHYLTHHP
jgi:glutamate carboxypeptidase